MIDPETTRRVVRLALEEDLGSGDLTSRAALDASIEACGRILARDDLILAGIDVAREVFLQVDVGAKFSTTHRDGASIDAGQEIAVVKGSARSILAGERTALNFLQRMSGIATVTRRIVERLRGTGTEVSDTRKTAPGLRAFDKHAVAAGGGANHRFGLFDAVLIKDNHWRLGGGIAATVRRVREGIGADGQNAGRIEVEVGTIQEVNEALEAGVDALLLDNMDPVTLKQAVNCSTGRAFLEVSGGISEADVGVIAAMRVQRISIGSLTHSVRAADIALEMESL